MAGRTDQKQVSVYLSEEMYSWLSKDSESSGMSRAAFLRHVLETWRSEREGRGEDGVSTGSAAGPQETAESHGHLVSQLSESRERVMVLEGDVRTLTAERDGLEAIIAMHRERLGLADSQNISLNLRLEAAQTSLDRLTLMLPAPGETSSPKRFNWRFWQRPVSSAPA